MVHFFDVLWPPAKIVHDGALNAIRRAIKDFKKALEEDEITKQLYNRVKGEGVFKEYDVDGENIYEQNFNNIDIETEKIHERLWPGVKRRELPDVVKRANESLRKAANHLSLVLLERNNRFLFLGDIENYEIKEIINDLIMEEKKCFYILITPHHGTHWDNVLKEIRCIYSVTSNGNKLYARLKDGFKYISMVSFSTYVNGDIQIPMYPYFKIPIYLL